MDLDLSEPDTEWRGILSALDGETGPMDQLRGPLAEIFAPLMAAHRTGQPLVIAQIGQSLDGRVATLNGESRFINGDEGLAHLHRLRALVDAVVIGVDTAILDDPLLTVRHVDGKSPARVVIDPKGRLPCTARLLANDGTRRITISGSAVPTTADAEHVCLQAVDGRIPPHKILEALTERGIHRVLIEGGPKTVSAFLADGCVDRLHVVVAPVLIGSGRTSIDLPPIERLAHAVRPPTRVCLLGAGEALFDMDLSERRRHNGN